MNEEIKFNIKPYIPNFIQLLLGGDGGSRTDPNTKEIFIYYHKNKPEELAWKLLIFDVDHECFHIILMDYIDKETSITWDTIIGLETSKWLNEGLYKDFQEEVKKNHNGRIIYNNNGNKEAYNNEK